MKKSNLKRLTLAAMFLAMGIILPFFTGQIQQIGSMLLPMHIPIFLAAFICGWQYAAPIAIILPLLRSILFSVPPMFPTAISVAAEMAVYALVAGLIYGRAQNKTVGRIYIALLAAMVAGRIARTAVQLSLLSIAGIAFSQSTYFSGVILLGIPGVILQLIIIPLVMAIYEKRQSSAK